MVSFPRISVAVVGCTCAVLAMAQSHGPALSGQTIFKRCSPFVVTVQTDTGSGTGFTVVDDQVYTCYHVVAGAKDASVVFPDGYSLPISGVLSADADKDIAIVAVPGLATHVYFGRVFELLPPLHHAGKQTPTQGKSNPAKYEPKGPNHLTLGDFSATQIGEPVYVIGSPLGLSHTLTEGIVSGKRMLGDTDLLQLSAGVSPGSSGSPVLNSRGQVIGMVTGTLKEGQLLNFAISGKDLKSQPIGVPLTVACPAKPATGSSEASPSEPAPSGTTAGLLANPDEALAFPHGPQTFEILDYRGVDDTAVLIEDLPKELTDALTRSSVEIWVGEKLQENGIRVIPLMEESRRQLTPPASDTSDILALKREDSECRQIYVNIGAIKGPVGTTFFTVRAEFQRAGFLYPGFYSRVTVGSEEIYGEFGQGQDAESVIHMALNKVLQRIAEKIKAASSG